MRFAKLILIFTLAIWVFYSCTSTEKEKSQPISPELVEHYKMLLDKGEKIYTDSCVMCHATKKGKHFLLKDITTRLDRAYFYLYLTKQDSLIRRGNKYALDIKREFNNMGNNHNFKFTKEELEAIWIYLK